MNEISIASGAGTDTVSSVVSVLILVTIKIIDVLRFLATQQTSGALAFFFLAMRLYPDVMHKAQAELDAVVGRERMPIFKDEGSLPYVSSNI